MKNKIKSISYNFHQIGSTDHIFEADMDYAEIGKPQGLSKEIPREIVEHEPTNGLQKHFVDIHYKSGAKKRVFNLCEITYYSPDEWELVKAQNMLKNYMSVRPADGDDIGKQMQVDTEIRRVQKNIDELKAKIHGN